jgi:hypothetical protein
MTEYTIPLSPTKPQTIATAPIPSHGALRRADSNSTTPKCTTLGVEKASPACASPRATDLPAMRVMTTNCNPISAPADEPTIT